MRFCRTYKRYSINSLCLVILAVSFQILMTATNVDGQTRFDTIKVIVGIGDLYTPDSSKGNRANIGLIGRQLNSYITRYVLPQLRKQGFKATYLGARNAESLPDPFKEPTLIVYYEETQGGSYFGQNGVNIICNLELFDAGPYEDQRALWSKLLTARNNYEVKVNVLDSNGSFRRDTLNELKTEFENLHLDFSGYKSK